MFNEQEYIIMKIVSTFADRLREAANGMSATEIADKIGISKQSVSAYLLGTRKPKRLALLSIAEILSVDPAWLMGYDADKMPQAKKPLPAFDNISPIRTKRFPLLGDIACGKPIFCAEDRESYVTAGTDIKADFCLTAHGDSMTGARIHDGDIVFIREQDSVDNGQIAAVIIDDSATLKRIFYYPQKQKLVLQAENPLFEPLVYVGDELDQVRILGLAVAFQSDVK